MNNTLKKILALMVCIAMVFCFTACGGSDEETAPDTEDEEIMADENVSDEEDIDPNDPTADAEDPADTEEEEEEPEEEDETQATETQSLEDKEADLAALQQSASESDAPHTGTYVEATAGRGIIIVNKVGDVYSVVVNWSDSAYESYEWVFSGEFDDRGVLEYSDCIKKDIVYEVEEEGTVSKIYEDGTGRLRLTDDGLIWEDDIEHIADDISFINTDM